MISLAAKGWPNHKLADRVGACAHTVGKWRRRFLDFRMAGLGALPRAKKPMRTGWKDVAHLLRKTLETTPRE